MEEMLGSLESASRYILGTHIGAWKWCLCRYICVSYQFAVNIPGAKQGFASAYSFLLPW